MKFDWNTFMRENPAIIYLLKVNNRNIRKRCEICLKSARKTPEWRHRRCSGVSIVNFEHVIAGWELGTIKLVNKNYYKEFIWKLPKATTIGLREIHVKNLKKMV